MENNTNTQSTLGSFTFEINDGEETLYRGIERRKNPTPDNYYSDEELAAFAKKYLQNY